MLTIREEQMQAMGQVTSEVFEEEMFRYLKARFKIELRETPDKEVEKLIHLGIKKAASYDVLFENDIKAYLEFTVLLGQDFDTNPKTVWAQNILRQNIIGTEKVDLLGEEYLFVR